MIKRQGPETLNYELLAHNVEQSVFIINTMVRALMNEGFTPEQARDIIAGGFRAHGGDHA